MTVIKTLDLKVKLPETNNGRLYCDSQYQGEIIIHRIRALGPEHPYIARLAANQIRALSNCNWPKPEEPALPERNWSDIPDPIGKLTLLAEHDHAYLAGVALFHHGRFDSARTAFAKVGADAVSLHRDAGRLMEVRSLRKLGAIDEAYSLAKRYRIEAGDKFKVALDEQEDIIAQHSDSTVYSAAHLEKIFRRVSGLPIENETPGFRAQQANSDFDIYFMNEFARLADWQAADLPHDWWLRNEPPNARRAFLAVHQLAKRYDGVDWVQAYHASVAFDHDNTWFAGPDIAVDDPAYDRVTGHAYKKWKAGAPRWAMIVAKRMAPDSKYVQEMTDYADKLRKRAASCSLSPVEYIIYARVVHHVVRALTSSGDYEKAFAVLSTLNQNMLYPVVEGVTGTNSAYVKLLMIRGEYGLVEELKDSLEDPQNRYFDWRYKLAMPNHAILWAAQSHEGLAKTHPDHFMRMVNMISSDSLEAMLNPASSRARLQYTAAARVAEVLWMRGFVFGDEAQMERVEPLLLRPNRGLQRYFRHAAAAKTPKARDFARAVMVLRNPGLTPYFDAVRPQRDLNIAEYSSANPIEGNWWCDGDDRAHLPSNEERIKAVFFEHIFRPHIYQRTMKWRHIDRPGYSREHEDALIDEAWKRFRSTYSPFKIISKEEQDKLAALPRASAWLAEKVRAYIDSPAGADDRKAPRDERIPESLHRIVDTTRYSCHMLERGNANTSQWAYATLHRYYGDTTWAAQTPYWFDTISRYKKRHRRH